MPPTYGSIAKTKVNTTTNALLEMEWRFYLVIIVQHRTCTLNGWFIFLGWVGAVQMNLLGRVSYLPSP
jgi:hypothetical protein